MLEIVTVDVGAPMTLVPYRRGPDQHLGEIGVVSVGRSARPFSAARSKCQMELGSKSNGIGEKERKDVCDEFGCKGRYRLMYCSLTKRTIDLLFPTVEL